MRTPSHGVLAAALALLLAPAHGQPLVPDNDGDGHPLFGVTARRADVERFEDQSLLATGVDIAFGDLNGDGHTDAAVAVSNGQPGPDQSFQLDYVSVLLGSGDGVFTTPAVHLLEGDRELTDVGLADFDGDGDLDLAVTDAMGDAIVVAFNDGDAAFSEDATYSAGDEPRSLRAADVNADGHPDVVALNLRSDDVSVFLNRGDGTFEPERRIAVGGVTQRGVSSRTSPYPGPFFALGDLNGDGAPDLAIPAGGRIKLLFNGGDGSFTLTDAHPAVVNFSAYDVEMGDLDGDGDRDLAAISTGGPATESVSVLINRGDGSFEPPVGYSADALGFPFATYFFTALAMGDVDGDGDLDLVTGQEFFSRNTLLRNKGDGTFAQPEPQWVTEGSWVMALEDVNADARPELVYVAGTFLRRGFRVALNDGSGGFHAMRPEPPPDENLNGCCDGANDLDAGDLDADGHTDLVVVRQFIGREEIIVLRGDGAGGLSVERMINLGTLEEGAAWDVALGDVTGNGLPDLVIADRVSKVEAPPGLLWVVPNLGGMEFGTPESYDIGQLGRVVLADFNGDGALDAATWSRGPGLGLEPSEVWVRTFINQGNGTLEPGERHTLDVLTPVFIGNIDAGDLNGDGAPDLVATVGRSGDIPGLLYTLTNDGSGDFEVTRTQEIAWQPREVKLADIDGDGDLDAAVVYSHGSGPPEIRLEILLEPYLTILTNDGTGRLTASEQFIDPTFHEGRNVVVADMFGDGGRDLVLRPANHLAVARHLGGTSYAPRVGYGTIGRNPEPVVADFNGDGRPDIATITDIGAVEMMLNVARRPCAADIDGDGSVTPSDFAAYLDRFAAGDPKADMDHDGTITSADFLEFIDLFSQGCP